VDPTRELAHLISKRQPIPGNEQGQMDLARGKVSQLIILDASSNPVPGFIGVKIDGSTTTVACEKLASYSPTLNDIVEILYLANRALVIGAVGNIGAQPPMSPNYCIMGTVNPYVSGADYWIPEFYVHAKGQVELTGVRGIMHGGTATVDIYHGGTLLSAVGLSGIVLTTTDTLFSAYSPVLTADGNTFRAQITATGPGDGLSLGFVFETVA
jgi:hypothetical protein